MIPFVDLGPYVDLVAGPQGVSGFEHQVKNLLEAREFVGSPSPTTTRFEIALAKKLDAQHAVACANGTDALQLALRASRIGYGDRVAMPNITFWATFEAIVNIGATPVLLDIDDGDYQLSLEALIRAFDTHPFSAVVLPHLFGWCSAQLGEIRKFCQNNRVLLIEDCAQAFGVKYEGDSIFKDAEIATLSFYPAKVIGGIGDGGAVLTNNPRIAARVRQLANHGRSAHFEHAVVGWNSRMDAIQAAWLLRALDVADTVIEERRRLVRLYPRPAGPHVVPPMNVDDNGYLALNMIPPDVPRWGNLSPAYRVQEWLHERGVEGRRIYPIAIDDQPGARAVLTLSDGRLPVSREFAARAFCLPLWYGMTDEQVEHCATAFEEVLG